MKRKAWIKRKRKSVKLDVGKTVRMWAINILVVVVVAFLWVSLASAQPELKVKTSTTGTVTFSDRGTFVYPGDGWECRLIWVGDPIHGENLTVGRSCMPPLKPAPRPEFKLLNEYRGCQDVGVECDLDSDFDAIAKELRYLREQGEKHHE